MDKDLRLMTWVTAEGKTTHAEVADAESGLQALVTARATGAEAVGMYLEVEQSGGGYKLVSTDLVDHLLELVEHGAEVQIKYIHAAIIKSVGELEWQRRVRRMEKERSDEEHDGK